MAPHVAVGLTLAGVALLLLRTPVRRRMHDTAAALLGSAVATIGGVALFGYAMHVPTAYGWGSLVEVPPHAAASLVVLGTGLAAAAWHRRAGVEGPGWMAVPASAGVLLFVLLTWWALVSLSDPHGPVVPTSRAAEAVLVLGIIVATLMGLVLRIAQRASTTSRQLRTEIVVRRIAERAVEASEEQFRTAFTHAPIGMALLSVDPLPFGTLRKVNDVLCRMLDRAEDELVGTDLATLIDERDLPSIQPLAAQLAGGTVDSYRTEARYLRSDGHRVWVQVSSSMVHAPDGGTGWVVAQIEDITARKDAEMRLAHLALHDALTGLANRAQFDDHTANALARAERSGCPPVVFLFDLDGFKGINDRLGHRAGDIVLRDLGERLRDSVRPSDTVARLGGDEFVALCEDLATPTDAELVAQRLLDAVTVPFEIDGRDAAVTASIGIAIAGEDDTSETLIHRADLAMYRAKAEGKARYVTLVNGSGRT
jgi:diguanylate cyclase (GGDEF)-like protein/PAS domain S-box-containing protein